MISFDLKQIITYFGIIINAFRLSGEKLPSLFSFISSLKKSRGISEKRRVKSTKRKVTRECGFSFWYRRKDLILVAATQSRAFDFGFATLLGKCEPPKLDKLASGNPTTCGSDSPPGCHSTPLPFKSLFYACTKEKSTRWVLSDCR